MSFKNSTVFDEWHLWSLRTRGSVKTLKQCWQIRTFLQTALKSILNGFCARSISVSIFTIFLKTKFLWNFGNFRLTEKLRFIYSSVFETGLFEAREIQNIKSELEYKFSGKFELIYHLLTIILKMFRQNGLIFQIKYSKTCNLT